MEPETTRGNQLYVRSEPRRYRVANADEIIEAAKMQAKVEADKVVAGAKAEIEQEAARAKESLRERVAELAVAGAEKILRREIDAKVHADILLAIEKDL